MKAFDKKIKINTLEVRPYNIIFSYTSPQDYEMDRIMLLEGLDSLKHGEFLLIEGSHCSCYDFDETEWEGTIYKKEELLKLANAPYNVKKVFWRMVIEYFG